MTIMVIESAADMHEHADTYLSHVVGALLRGQPEQADFYRDEATFCRGVADAIDAGRVIPGDYRWTGAHRSFQAALLAGRLTPEAPADAGVEVAR